FTHTATTYTYTLSLHDALPISVVALEEVLAGDLPVGSDLELRAEAELEGVHVDDLGKLSGCIAERVGERCRVRVRIDEDHRSPRDRKSTRLNSSHVEISYAVFC